MWREDEIDDVPVLDAFVVPTLAFDRLKLKTKTTKTR